MSSSSRNTSSSEVGAAPQWITLVHLFFDEGPFEQRPLDQINSQSQNLNAAPQQVAPQLVSINAASFGAKYASKREVYRFLSSKARIYLPNYESVTIFHMRDIVAGRRKKIKLDVVKVITVP